LAQPKRLTCALPASCLPCRTQKAGSSVARMTLLVLRTTESTRGVLEGQRARSRASRNVGGDRSSKPQALSTRPTPAGAHRPFLRGDGVRDSPARDRIVALQAGDLLDEVDLACQSRGRWARGRLCGRRPGGRIFPGAPAVRSGDWPTSMPMMGTCVGPKAHLDGFRWPGQDVHRALAMVPPPSWRISWHARRCASTPDGVTPPRNGSCFR